MELIKLRDYQEECLLVIETALERLITRQLISLPTGTGKTIIFCEEAKRAEGRSLILVHRDELIEQAKEKLSIIWPEAEVGVVKAERNEVTSSVILASVQTLARQPRLRQLGKEFSLVVTDEAHHGVAKSYLNIYDYLELPRPDTLSLGVTATPFRADERGLKEAFDEVVYHRTILEMIEQGYLCDLRGLRIETSCDLDQVRIFRGDFVEKDLANVVNAQNRNELIVEAYQNYGEGRLTLCFTVDVQHAEDLAETFQAAGIKAAPISGQTPSEERKALLKLFRAQEIKVLCNCLLLTEGYDEPEIGCIILARPTQSAVLYTQMVGRGTRFFPGKKDCLIIDIADVSRRHKLAQLPDLIGKEIPPDASRSVLEVIRKEKEERVRPELVGPYRELVGVTPIDFFGKSRYRWRQRGKDVFYLDLGPRGRVGVFLEDDKWQVGFRARERREIEIIRKDLNSLSWAFGIAESVAEEKGGIGLILKRARWRQDPATAKQKEWLDRYGVTYPPNITKGEASDILSRLFERR